jgi:hypothetical protein
LLYIFYILNMSYFATAIVDVGWIVLTLYM